MSLTDSRPPRRLGTLAVGLCLLLTSCGDAADESAAPATTEPTTTTTTSTTTTAASATSTTATTTSTSTEASEAEELGPGCSGLVGGLEEVTMIAGGAEHDVRIYVPSSFDGSALPAVVNWHGLGSSGPEQAAYSGYEGLAETEGFIAVHPTGVPAPGDTRNSWELVDAQDPGRDDLAFAVSLFDTLIDQWCVDGDRIFSTGMSNGGFFTARLVCEVPERLAGAVSVAGIFHPPGCSPTEAVPFLAYHGTDDAVVPYDGSGESVLSEDGDSDAAGFFSQVMPDEFEEFANDAGCGAPTRSELSTEVVRYDYPGCGVDMAFFEVVGGGHTWPGSPLAAVTAALGFTTDDVSATEDGWAFFAGIE